MKYSVHRKLLCELSILVYKFRPKRTGFNVYAEYTRPQLTFLALHPWMKHKHKNITINISTFIQAN